MDLQLYQVDPLNYLVDFRYVVVVIDYASFPKMAMQESWMSSRIDRS